MIGYVAKDKNGKIYFHRGKPTYDNKLEVWYCTLGMINITGQFPELDDMSYTDEPIKIEIKLEQV